MRDVDVVGCLDIVDEKCFLKLLKLLLLGLNVVSYKFFGSVKFDNLWKSGYGYDYIEDDLFVLFVYMFSLFNVR